MLFPHKEIKTPNLCQDYKKELEQECTKNDNEYHKQAIDFLLSVGLGLEIIKTGQEQKEHGLVDIYKIYIFPAYSKDNSRYQLTDKFYNSVHNTEKKEHLHAYDVLAYFSMYAFNEFMSVDDVVEEYGDMKPSQAIAIYDEAENTRKILRSLMSDNQLEQLTEIV